MQGVCPFSVASASIVFSCRFFGTSVLFSVFSSELLWRRAGNLAAAAAVRASGMQSSLGLDLVVRVSRARRQES